MKNREPLVSVIVPVYNTERFVKKCVRSIICQSYVNIEIILVDDGSIDRSADICDELAREYKNVTVYHSAKNRGQSYARNIGLKKSRGEYISFIDSDDYIASDMIERLIAGCEKNDAEMGCTNKVRVSSNGEEFPEEISSKRKIVNSEEALLLLLLSYDPSPCNKVYRKGLFDGTLFPEGVVYEDILTIPKLIDACEKIYFDNKYGYYYVQNEKSTVHSSFSAKKLNYYHASKWLYEFILEKYPNLKMAAEHFYILSLTTIITEIYPARDKFKKEYSKIIRELGNFKKRYLRNQYIPWPKKIMIFMDLHGMGNLVNFIKKMRHNERFN